MLDGLFPKIEDIQNAVINGYCALNDEETYSPVEGCLCFLLPDDYKIIEDADEALDDDSIVRFRIDSMPYLVRAGFLMLGIVPDNLSPAQLKEQLDSVSAAEESQSAMISALRLAMSDMFGEE